MQTVEAVAGENLPAPQSSQAAAPSAALYLPASSPVTKHGESFTMIPGRRGAGQEDRIFCSFVVSCFGTKDFSGASVQIQAFI